MTFHFHKPPRRSLSASPIQGEVLSFVLGSLAVAIAHKMIDRSLDIFPGSLALGLLAVAVWNMLYMRSVSSRIGRLFEDNLVSVRYFHEPFDSASGFRPTGQIHEILGDLVRRADEQILIFGVHWDLDQNPQEKNDSERRKQYLDAIESKLVAADEFDYVRIIQVPANSEGKDLKSVLDLNTYHHCQRVAKIAAESKDKPGIRIRFFRTSQRMAGGFMLIDQRHLALGLDGTSVSRSPCFSSLLSIDDRGGSIVRDWRLHFEDIKDSAQALNSKEFPEDKLTDQRLTQGNGEGRTG